MAVKIEAMSDDAIDNDCFIVDNQGSLYPSVLIIQMFWQMSNDMIQLHFLFAVGVEIEGTVTKHEINYSEPNSRDGQSDGAGHGENGLEFTLTSISISLCLAKY